MSLADRLARLEPRERRLLAILAGVFALVVLLGIPVAIAASVHGRASENEALRDAMTQLEENREAVVRAMTAKQLVARRYATPAPPLGSFLAAIGTQAGVEITESQDRQAVPHGKRYSERSTKIVVRKVGMFKLAKLMEGIEQSGHPLTISALNVRKRGPDPDNYDADMVVSAYDRKAPEPSKAAAKDGAAPAEAASAEGSVP